MIFLLQFAGLDSCWMAMLKRSHFVQSQAWLFKSSMKKNWCPRQLALWKVLDQNSNFCSRWTGNLQKQLCCWLQQSLDVLTFMIRWLSWGFSKLLQNCFTMESFTTWTSIFEQHWKAIAPKQIHHQKMKRWNDAMVTFRTHAGFRWC